MNMAKARGRDTAKRVNQPPRQQGVAATTAAKAARPTPPPILSEIARRYYKYIFIALLVITAVSRFYNLETKVFHHDESLYAKYVWDYAEGRPHLYDPLMHGPFMFLTNGMLMRVIGDSDYKVRSYSAIFGILHVALTHLLLPVLGAAGTLLAALWFTFSPHFVYYGRFFREDIYTAVFIFMPIIGALRYAHNRKWRWLVFAALGLALLFGTKESSFLHTFEFAVFIISREIYLLLRGLCRRPGFSGVTMTDMDVGDADTTAWERVPRGALLRERLSALADWIWSNKFKILLVIGVFAAVFYAIFTSFFAHPKGFVDGLGRKAIPYWKHQNAIQRVRGEYHYYMWRLLMYDLPIVIGALAAVALAFRKRFNLMIAAVAFSGVMLVLYQGLGHVKLPAYVVTGDYGKLSEQTPEILAKVGLIGSFFDHMHMQTWAHPVIFLFVFVIGFGAAIMFIERGFDIPAFFSYRAAFCLLLYSYLGEKVSWLGIHIYQPMIILLAWGGQKYLRRSRIWFPAFVGLSVLFMSYASYGLNYYKGGINEANPNEIICYTQTDDDVEWINGKIEEARKLSGLGFDMPLSISGSATWPYSWYLRHYTRWFTPPNAVPSTNAMVVVMDWSQKSKFDYLFQDNYVMYKKKLRSWQVLPSLYETKGENKIPWSRILHYFFFRLERTPLYKDGLGSYDVAVFIRKDLDQGQFDPNFGRDTTKTEEMQRKAETLRPQRFNPVLTWGSFGTEPGQYKEPRAIAASQQDWLVIADTMNHRIQKVSKEGQLLKTWGMFGTEKGQFNQPSGVAVDSAGFIYVSDTWNHRIQKFTSDGEHVMSWGQGGCGGDLDFWAPKGLVVTKTGSLFVVNTGCHRVHKFTRDGVFIRLVGMMNENEETAMIDSFHEPVGIAEGPDGRIYICDTANHRVQVFDQDLVPRNRFRVWGWDEFYTEPFITFDPQGTLYVTDAYNARIERFTTTGELLMVWGDEGKGPGSFSEPKGLCSDSEFIYVVEKGNNRIQKFAFSSFPAVETAAQQPAQDQQPVVQPADGQPAAPDQSSAQAPGQAPGQQPIVIDLEKAMQSGHGSADNPIVIDLGQGIPQQGASVQSGGQ